MTEQQPVLFVGEIDEDINLSVPASSGEEYIKQVIVQARQCESVAVGEIDETRFKKSTINVRPVSYSTGKLSECTASNLGPSLEWQKCQVADFSKTRLYVARIKDEIQTSKRKWEPPPVKFPDIKDQQGWINLCLGSIETEYKALLPTLDVILALNQPTIENVLEYLVDFIEEQGIIQFDLGRWIYALLVTLELPLNPEVCSCLRSLVRECSVIRAKMTESDDSRVITLNLFICLVARYFRQLDLADQ